MYHSSGWVLNRPGPGRRGCESRFMRLGVWVAGWCMRPASECARHGGAPPSGVLRMECGAPLKPPAFGIVSRIAWLAPAQTVSPREHRGVVGREIEIKHRTIEDIEDAVHDYKSNFLNVDRPMN